MSNAATAMTAYGASVWITPPDGLRVTRLAGTAALTGWTCTLSTLSCHGTLPPGERGQISISGTVAPQARRTAPAPQARGPAALTGIRAAPGRSRHTRR